MGLKFNTSTLIDFINKVKIRPIMGLKFNRIGVHTIKAMLKSDL